MATELSYAKLKEISNMKITANYLKTLFRQAEAPQAVKDAEFEAETSESDEESDEEDEDDVDDGFSEK